MNESKTKKLQVGDKLYAVLVGTRSYEREKWVTITKVGRLYFEVDEIYRERFRVDDLRVDGSTSNSYWKLYNSEEERAEEDLESKNRQKVSRAFSSYTTQSYTRDQIARIVAIIEEPKQ